MLSNQHKHQVVLFQPEIPQNTGSIGRLCVATQSPLHLIEPLGFDISAAAVKRAGLDYWEHLQLKTHTSFEDFLKTTPQDAPLVFLSKKAGHTIYDYPFQKGSYLVFGRETSGLPDWILNHYPTQTVRIPIFDARVRSLNLATAVGISLYEAIRQVSQ